MAKRKKKKVEPVVPTTPELTDGQWYWCVNCGHHGDFGFHRKKSVKCESCLYEWVTIWTLEEINDEHIDHVWLERFKTKKMTLVETGLEQAKKRKFAPDPTTDSKGSSKGSLKKKLEVIKQMGKK